MSERENSERTCTVCARNKAYVSAFVACLGGSSILRCMYQIYLKRVTLNE